MMVNELIFYRFYFKNRTNLTFLIKIKMLELFLVNLDGLSISKSFQTVFDSLGGDGFWNVGASGDFDAGFFCIPKCRRSVVSKYHFRCMGWCIVCAGKLPFA